jgi:hypothetical protein
LDNFIAPIPGFEGETPIPAIIISAQTLSAESVGASSRGPSAGSSKTRAGKCKAAFTPPPPQKIRKAMRKKAMGIKINDPTHETLVLSNSSKLHPRQDHHASSD